MKICYSLNGSFNSRNAQTEHDGCLYKTDDAKLNITKRLHKIYCKSGNFREGFIFAKLRICEVS